VAADVPAFVTKEDVSEAQHEEARIYGGQNPRGGMAAQMQVSELRVSLLCATGCGADYQKSAADKLAHARRGS
jgi:hypothetical protein